MHVQHLSQIILNEGRTFGMTYTHPWHTTVVVGHNYWSAGAQAPEDAKDQRHCKQQFMCGLHIPVVLCLHGLELRRVDKKRENAPLLCRF